MQSEALHLEVKQMRNQERRLKSSLQEKEQAGILFREPREDDVKEG